MLKLVAALIMGLLAGPLMAHALLVTAQAQAGAIVGQAFYSDGTPATDETVEFFNPPDAKTPTGSVQTDGAGRFAWAEAVSGNVLVVAYGMEGHRAVATVQVTTAGSTELTATSAADVALLRQDIARLHARIRLSDIVGGIGYIVGLAGLYLFWLTRRRP